MLDLEGRVCNSIKHQSRFGYGSRKLNVKSSAPGRALGRYVVTQMPSLRRTRQQRLTGRGSTCRRRTGRDSLTRSTTACEYSARHRSTRRSQRDQRSTGRNRHGEGGASWDRRTRGNWGTGWNRRRTSHSGDRGARRRWWNTHLRDHRGAGDCWRTDFTRGSLDARVAARYQRGSCCVRAECYRDAAQPNASNDFDA